MSLIKKPSELINDSPITCMIYGQPGCGKTSFALSASNPLLIDLDRGLHRVAAQNQCDSVQPDTLDQVLSVLYSHEINSYKTIVIDTFGKLVDMICKHVGTQNPRLKQYDGTLNPKGWGIVKMQAQEIISRLFAWRKNIIFVAHEKEEDDGTTRVIRPKVSGSSASDLIIDIDLLGYMQMKGNVRTVCFSPTEKFYAKNSLELPDIIELPNNSGGNDAFQRLIEDKVAEQRILENQNRDEYYSLIEEHKKLTESIKDIDSLNEVYKTLKESKNIWNSGRLWRLEIKKRTEELGADFDTDSEIFVKTEAKKEAA